MEILYIIPVAVVLWVIVAFNGFVRARNRVKEASSDIEVQLKRRYDLIPNLIEAVKGYMAHEKGTLEKVTEARVRAMGAPMGKEKVQAENALSSTLKTLFAVSENYPDLKANANFLDLQRELSDTENKIQAARRFFNSVVMDLNNRAESFPTSIIANIFKFHPAEFFDADDEVNEPVKVKF